MKRKKRNTLLSIAAIGVSGVLMAASALAVNNNLSAYTQLKNTMIEKKFNMDFSPAQTATSTLTFSIEKDENILAKSEIFHKVADGKQYSLATTMIQEGRPTTSHETWSEYTQSGFKNITKNSDDDTYYVDEFTYPEPMNDYDTVYAPSMSDADKKFISALLDTLSGDMKNYFSSDGTTTSLHLEGAQIPELAQLGLSSIQSQVAQDATGQIIKASSDGAEQLIKEFVAAKDLTFDTIDIQITNEMDVKGYVTAFGYDINGAKHNYTVRFESNTTDIGSTTVDMIDLTGKKVIMKDTHRFEDIMRDDDATTPDSNASGDATENVLASAS